MPKNGCKNDKKLECKLGLEDQVVQEEDSREIATTNDKTDTRHMNITVQLDGIKAVALIDSGAQGNYISARYMKERHIPWQQKGMPYRLSTVEGKEVEYGSGIVDKETGPLQVNILGTTDYINFDITDIAEHQLILGIPWLRRRNPRIDWTTDQIYWTSAPVESRNQIGRDDAGRSSLRRSLTARKHESSAHDFRTLESNTIRQLDEEESTTNSNTNTHNTNFVAARSKFTRAVKRFSHTSDIYKVYFCATTVSRTIRVSRCRLYLEARRKTRKVEAGYWRHAHQPQPQSRLLLNTTPPAPPRLPQPQIKSPNQPQVTKPLSHRNSVQPPSNATTPLTSIVTATILRC